MLASTNQIMVTACDKHSERYHIIMIDKKADVEAVGLGLDKIVNEELRTFDKDEFRMHMEFLKD